VLGIDASQRMLDRANHDSASDVSNGTIRYLRGDLDGIDLGSANFDVAYSSLTLHYIVDLEGLFATVRRSLVDGATLLYTAEHPIFTAPTIDRSVDVEGTSVWPLDRYSDEGQRTRNWLSDGVIKQHRTVATQINALINNGFVIDHIAEFGPNEAIVEAEPAFVIDRERPAFLIVKASAA